MGTPGLTGGSLSLFTRYEASFQGGLLSNCIPSSLYMKSGTNHFLRSEPGFQRAKLSHKDTNSSLWNSVTPAQQGAAKAWRKSPGSHVRAGLSWRMSWPNKHTLVLIPFLTPVPSHVVGPQVSSPCPGDSTVETGHGCSTGKGARD